MRGAGDEEAADECADGVRRLVAIQEWEEDALLGPPAPLRQWPPDGLRLGPLLTEPLLPPGPPRGEGLGEEDEEEEEPATPMAPCSPTNQGLQAWPLDCPEAPNSRCAHPALAPASQASVLPSWRSLSALLFANKVPSARSSSWFLRGKGSVRNLR